MASSGSDTSSRTSGAGARAISCACSRTAAKGVRNSCAARDTSRSRGSSERRVAPRSMASSSAASPRVTVSAAPAQGVDCQRPELQRGGLLTTRAPVQGDQPGQLFVEVERFGQIVVGAPVQRRDLVLRQTARGQDQHRRARARLGAQAAERVQHDGIERPGGQGLEGIGATAHPLRPAARPLQPESQAFSDGQVVFDEEQFHGRTVMAATKKGGMRRPVPCPSGYCAAALRALCDFFFAGLAFFFFLAGALAWAETETPSVAVNGPANVGGRSQQTEGDQRGGDQRFHEDY